MSRSSGRVVARAIVPPLAAGLIRASWALSARMGGVTWIRPEHLDSLVAMQRPFILAFWHSRLWLMTFALRGHPVTALISRHEDGELIARAMERFGHSAARGSSTRGGASALREAMRVARAGGSLAITPDGPKGPAREVKPGVMELARATGVPVLPCSLAYRSSHAFASWDRFEVPLPGTRIAIAYDEPVTCERQADRAAIDAACRSLGARLDALTDECSAAVRA